MGATAAERSGRRAHPGAGGSTGGEVCQARAPRRASPARDARRPPPRAAGTAPLRLVAAGGRLIPQVPAEPVRTGPGRDVREDWLPARGTPAPGAPRPPESLRRTGGGAVPRHPARPSPATPPAGPAPLRLTRRGRLAAAAGAVLAAAAISVGLAGAAPALAHSGAPARPGAGLTRVQVRPGQSLWSLAEAYDPNADTRQVIQEILQLNSMSTTSLQPGQVLWMPRR